MQSGVYETRPRGSLCSPVVEAVASRCRRCLRPGAGDRLCAHVVDRRAVELLAETVGLRSVVLEGKEADESSMAQVV